ncbi:MAG TPA: tetratricopeptide repeat protein [Candidatus Acidoferrales bacterium]|nr:tetratricopeptide repeat protein [Candidatus Acidoferrales bacterium]
MSRIKSVDKSGGDKEHPRKSRDAILYGLLILAGVLPYLNTLAFTFVYDDNYQVVSNPYLRSFHYWKQILVTPVWSFKYAKVATNYYRPLMSLQYLFLYQAYGPLAYVFHLGNVLLNTATVLLLFAITRRLFGSDRMGFLAAVLFAFHPVHSEPVSWVAAVPDLQLGVFLLCAIWFYLDYGEPLRRKWWTPIALSISFLLALLSKEPAIALPVIFIVYEYFIREDRQKTNWKQKFGRYAPVWIVACVYLGARVLLIGGMVPRLQRPRLSWTSTLLSSVSLFGDYMNKLIWPVRLNIYYLFVPTTSPMNPAFIAGVACLLGLALLTAVLWKRQRMLILAILLMTGTLAPVLNARWMPANVFAERYLYVPSMGFCWLLAAGVLALWDARAVRQRLWVRPAISVIMLVIAGLSVVRIVTRNQDWFDDLTLFSAAVKQYPDNSSLNSDLGFAYWAKRDETAAVRYWKLAVSEDPNNVWPLDDLGMEARVHKRYSEAIPLLQRAVKISPQFTDARMNLAQALAGLGRNEEAEAEFQAAVASSPLDWDVQNRFAQFYMDTNRIEMANQRFLISVEVLPNSDAFDGLGDIALQRGQTSLAEQYFRRAVRLDEYDHHGHYELVLIYAQSGNDAEAIKEFNLGEATDIGNDPLEKQAKAIIEGIRKK